MVIGSNPIGPTHSDLGRARCAPNSQLSHGLVAAHENTDTFLRHVDLLSADVAVIGLAKLSFNQMAHLLRGQDWLWRVNTCAKRVTLASYALLGKATCEAHRLLLPLRPTDPRCEKCQIRRAPFASRGQSQCHPDERKGSAILRCSRPWRCRSTAYTQTVRERHAP